MGQRLAAFIALLSTTAFPVWALDQRRSTAQAVANEYLALHGDVSINEFFHAKGMAIPAQASSRSDRRPLAYALLFFDGLPRGDADTALRAIRPHPVTAEERRRVRATLPAEGEVTPTPREAMMLDALRTVLVYHQRHDVFEIKVIDIPQAWIALHGRAILLISRQALRLLSAARASSVVAHEIGHDFFWGEFQLALATGNTSMRQQVELQCDGIAALTLVAIGVDPAHLGSALQKFSRLNRAIGASADAEDYPTPRDRQHFVAALLKGRGQTPNAHRSPITACRTSARFGGSMTSLPIDRWRGIRPRWVQTPDPRRSPCQCFEAPSAECERGFHKDCPKARDVPANVTCVPSSPAAATCPSAPPRAGSPETSIKLGCGCGPIAPNSRHFLSAAVQFKISVRGTDPCSSNVVVTTIR